GQGGGLEAVEIPTAAVDDATEQPVADAQARIGADERDTIAAAHAGEASVGEDERLIPFEADDLGLDGVSLLAGDAADRAQRRGKPRDRGREADDLRHAAGECDGENAAELFGCDGHGGCGMTNVE